MSFILICDMIYVLLVKLTNYAQFMTFSAARERLPQCQFTNTTLLVTRETSSTFLVFFSISLMYELDNHSLSGYWYGTHVLLYYTIVVRL